MFSGGSHIASFENLMKVCLRYNNAKAYLLCYSCQLFIICPVSSYLCRCCTGK